MAQLKSSASVSNEKMAPLDMQYRDVMEDSKRSKLEMSAARKQVVDHMRCSLEMRADTANSKMTYREIMVDPAYVNLFALSAEVDKKIIDFQKKMAEMQAAHETNVLKIKEQIAMAKERLEKVKARLQTQNNYKAPHVRTVIID